MLLETEIKTPTLIVNEAIAKRNIARMAAKLVKSNKIFRPHFKTHQSAKIGAWFKEYGVKKITVSSVSMANYFADAGWNDITIAFPCNIREMEQINELAKRITLNILIDNASVVAYLVKHAKYFLGVYLKLDLGNQRCGIKHTDIQFIKELIDQISKTNFLEFQGFLVHNGQTYAMKTKQEITSLYKTSADILYDLKTQFQHINSGLVLSFGDTPTCSLVDKFTMVDELRPGNFIFYDLMQWKIGSCKPEEIAVAVACPVVGSYPTENKVVIMGGGVHLSKETLLIDNRPIYGLALPFNNKGWLFNGQGWPVVSVSQEHGVIECPQAQSLQPGDLVYIIPVHSCMTVNQFPHYLNLEGEKIEKRIGF